MSLRTLYLTVFCKQFLLHFIGDTFFWLNLSEASCLHPCTPGWMLTSHCCQHQCCKGTSPALPSLFAPTSPISSRPPEGWLRKFTISLLRNSPPGVAYPAWWCWGAKAVTEWRRHGHRRVEAAAAPVDRTLMAAWVCFGHRLSWPSLPSTLKICTWWVFFFFSYVRTFKWTLRRICREPGSSVGAPTAIGRGASTRGWLDGSAGSSPLGFLVAPRTIHRPRMICKNYSATHFK